MFDKNKIMEKYSSAVAKSFSADAEHMGQNSNSLSGVSSMIGASVKIDGQITSEENLVIEGSVKGSITAKNSEVLVGKSGVLKANIVAKIVRIEGTINGDITGGENVIITKTGNVQGNIQSPRVSLEDGAKFKGSIEMDPSDKSVTELPVSGSSNVKAHRPGSAADAQAS
ncbi:polymer-forming cytoskeletal protein [Porticoccaceae bacterium]|jgi:cytoskeletal protein CcmA (bactofilin family)|nr:polymer-forming cytoskeletal protein [Porticoccaceae bacterium]MDB9842865.1 polymer-forming cytoskeletal protein [Porticoccaceae bacterium]MDC0134287.1 polymer-forming cytoskeletal protein [Porticoccaceae bacterium]MDC1477547.1 polymer-forming cytoskeletal protein [Porticoccaceae bacterium]|tara:strand:- start:3868 stop:4377 length:510 start_codon:yes stop_codon:yes gene_type:complete